MTIRVRKLIGAAAFVLCGLVGFARADLYTGSVPSLEWLVDSADEIYHVRVEAVPGLRGELTVRPHKAIKGGRPSLVKLRHAMASDEAPLFSWLAGENRELQIRIRVGIGKHQSLPAWPTRASDEWLWFARDGREQPLHIFRVVNLTRPRRNSLSAAVTSDGEPLATKQAIMEAIQKRLSLMKFRFPSESSREIIDRWSKRNGGIVSWARQTNKQDWFWSPEQVAAIRGGFSVSIECDYWDNPTNPDDADEDLLLTEAIVPADPEFLPVLKRQIENERPQESWVYALLSYPGEETEKLLKDIVNNRPSLDHAARRVLTYLRYRENLTDPLNKKLVGRWDLIGRRERIELNLSDDQTCIINAIPTKNDGGKRVAGKGYWAVRDGRFWLCRSHAHINEKWTVNLRQFFPAKKIEQFSPKEIILENGPPMKRP